MGCTQHAGEVMLVTSVPWARQWWVAFPAKGRKERPVCSHGGVFFCWILLIKADFGQGKEVNTVSPLQPMLWEASSLQKVGLSTVPFL